MRKVLGYGYKMRTEDVEDVVAELNAHWGLFKTRDEAEKWRKKDITEGRFDKAAKVNIFKIVAVIDE